MTPVLIFIMLGAFALVGANPIIRAIESGSGGTTADLIFGSSFCPFGFASGFSVQCLVPGATSVRFFVDNTLVSTQTQEPFVLNGLTDGAVNSWANFSLGDAQISCVGDNGCATIWKGRIECVGSPTPTPAAPIPPSVDNCVTVPGGEFNGMITDGWVLNETTNSVEYEPESSFGGIVPPNTAQLMYTFMVPIETTYGISIDMGTNGVTEHNDVFIRFSEGITLRRGDSVLDPNTGFVKAYHNRNGRSKQVFSVDNNPHTLSVSETLKPGVEYTVTIGARSTMTTVYGIILFPCFANECQSGRPLWQQQIALCNV